MTVASPSAQIVEQGARLRRLLAVDGPLAAPPVGTVPILWNDLAVSAAGPAAHSERVLDDITRTGYDGTQHGFGFPEGDALRGVLAARQLRLAEVYAAIPATPDGPTTAALEDVRDRLRILTAAGGEVLCVAFDGTADRDLYAGRADDPETPRLTGDGWKRTADLLATISAETRASGARIAFHPHAATYIETPDEVEQLVDSLAADVMPLCLDVGHFLVGGGDPVAALKRYGDRVTHVHVKDVDPEVLPGLRAGTVGGFERAVRGRLFTELGSGLLDLDGVLAALADRSYEGWLMIEQDSGWPPPAESAAIGRRVLATALRRLAEARGAAVR